MSFEFAISSTGGSCTIAFNGEIDESANFQNINLPDVNHLIIDLEKLTLLNSSGLRNWVLWTRGIKAAVITIRNCPSIAVHQVNVLEGFLPLRAVLESFELPYVCESCGREERRWITRGKEFMERTADKAEWVKYEENIKCQNCGQPAEVDVMPLRYFSFLKNRNM